MEGGTSGGENPVVGNVSELNEVYSAVSLQEFLSSYQACENEEITEDQTLSIGKIE